MQNSNSSKSPWLRKGVGFVALMVVFAIAYTQSPLYTSNQNQYFLHGLANADLGYLNQDWLANTLDPTPLFSKLVEFSSQTLQVETVFYIFYALLMGVYIFSLIGIVSRVYEIKKSRETLLIFIALLILLHSAAIRFAFSRSLGINWTYILEDGVADQRLLGPVFQPSTFGVLLVLSIYLYLIGRPYLAVLAASVAAIVHPTYLLSAVVLTASYMLSAYREQKNLLKPLLIGGLALLFVSPILWYVYSNFASTPVETSALAREILVDFRIPHHARISWWFDATAVLKIVLVGSALFVVRRHKNLFSILLLLALAAVLLTLTQVVIDSDVLALIFPWRISTLLVPISTALLLGYLVETVGEKFEDQLNKHQNTINLASLGVIILVAGIGIVRMVIDFDRKASGVDRPVMAHTALNKQPGDVYLTPVKMQDFRLATGAPVYVEFKSIPYRDTDVLEWYTRIQLANRFYKEGDCTVINEIAADGRVTHVVVENKPDPPACRQFETVYTDENYTIYEFQEQSGLTLSPTLLIPRPVDKPHSVSIDWNIFPTNP